MAKEKSTRPSATPSKSPADPLSKHSQLQAIFNTNKQQTLGGESKESFVQVESLFIGGGPATLGVMVNYVKTEKIADLLAGKGFAIVEASSSFGGGALTEYGIRSNTSAKGFIKIITKQNIKPKGDEAIVDKIQQSLSISKYSGEVSNGRSQSYAPSMRKNSRIKNHVDSFSNTLQKK